MPQWDSSSTSAASATATCTLTPPTGPKLSSDSASRRPSLPSKQWDRVRAVTVEAVYTLIELLQPLIP